MVDKKQVVEEVPEVTDGEVEDQIDAVTKPAEDKDVEDDTADMSGDGNDEDEE